MTLRSLVLASAVLLPLIGCTASTPKCDAKSCNGCCDGNGICQPGATSALCGGGGSACVACGANEACNSGACSAVTPVGHEDGGTQDAGTTCSSTPVTCADEALTKLGLKADVNPDGLTNTPDGAGFISVIKATAGGFPPTAGYVYASFTPTGLAQMPFGDEMALNDMRWDIAFQRYVIRLNGGDSGPSCVSAAIAGAASFDDVTASTSTGVPATDNFLDNSCGFVSDGKGLGTSPMTALSSYYSYVNCVKMTGDVFVITLADGRKVKAQVMGYYQSDSAQQSCNNGTYQGGAVSGYVKLRWAFL